MIKTLIVFVFMGLQLAGYCQQTVELYTCEPKIYLDYAEVEQKLKGITTALEGNRDISRIDTLLYSYNLLAYPDELKKYSIQNTLSVRIVDQISKDTLAILHDVQRGPDTIRIPIPAHFGNTFSFSVNCLTDYKKTRWKSPKTLTNRILNTVESRLIRYKRRGCTTTRYSCGYVITDNALNSVQKKSRYPINDLVIRIVPGVN